MRLFCLAFVLGTSWLQVQAELPEARVALAGLAALLALRLVPPGERAVRVTLFLAAGATLGTGLATWRAELRLADMLPLEWEGRDIELTGIVASLPRFDERGTRFSFDVQALTTAGATVPPRVALIWYAPRGSGAAPVLAAGERWRLVVRLKRPRGLANPHGFDFEPWALERGLRATGYVRASPAPLRLDARVEGWPWTLHRWRGEIRDAMAAHLGDARLGGVLVALAIGDQDAIAQQDWRVFWRTGVGHLMSISGLHITMLAALAMGIAQFAWVRLPGAALRLPSRKAGVAVAVLTALAYALLTGFAIPAQRTVLMLATLAACVLADRHGSASRVLALAAAVVLAADPWAVLASGFWLSFGAVAAIFYVLALRTGTAGRLRGAALEQLAVSVLMFPMMIALFQEASLVAPIANALAIPVVSLLVVPLTLAGAFLGAGILLDVAHQLMAWLMVPLESLGAWPGAVLESHAPVPWTVAAAVAGCAWLLAPRGLPLRWMGAIWIAPMFALQPPQPAPGEVWVDVLDVGHGLAIVVRTAAHALVYDAGPSWGAESDSGRRVVVPFLRGEGIRRLDALVVSHGDDDHYGGAATLADARRPAWLMSSLAPDDALVHAFATSMRCEAGQRWTWDGVRFEVLHPGAPAYLPERARKANDLGCVLRVASRGASLLLAADVESRGEAEMLARGTDALRSEVLLVPHHGSRTSSTAAFLDAVAPRVALLSVGHRDRFGHPHREVMERYAQRSIEVHRTDRRGALHLVLPAQAGAPVTVLGQEGRRRYWSDRGG